MEKITDISQLDPKGTYNYADYLTWKFEQVVEIIGGKILKMAAPSRKHQDISWQLSGKFYGAFNNLKCKAYSAPFDVRLLDKAKSVKANKDVLTVVQPDLCVICDLEKLDDRGCLGASDFMVEILSAGNSKKEMRTKKNLYEENGVREYWVVDPTHEILFQYILQENDKYSPPQVFVSDDLVQSAVFPTLQIALAEVFGTENSEDEAYPSSFN